MQLVGFITRIYHDARSSECQMAKRVYRSGVAQSVQRLPTGWTVRGSNPGRARFSAPIQTGLGAHPASCTKGTGSLPGVKRPGRGVDNPPHLAPRLKKE